MGSVWADLFILLLLISSGIVYGVSFYGNSYIHLQTVEKSIQTLIHVQFRTSSQSGLLFLAAGRRDFLLLELVSGRLQVHLNLGSGKRLLRSEKGIRLNDFEWHTVDLNHTHHNINMIVDRTALTNLQMPGPDLELSVEDGLLVGGMAGLNYPYLLNISTGFRGCMDEVVFNEHNLLTSLKPHSGYKSVHEVSLGCSPQFSATEDDPVSFFSSKAFISLPQWDVLQEEIFEFELHPSTKEGNGMVLFSSGSEGGFVAVEVRDGHLVALVGNGKGSKVELHSLTHIYSNHSWYPIQLHLLTHSIQLKVGKELVKANLNTELQVIRLKGPLFLGGLEDDALEKARLAGFPSGGGSFKGCLRKIRVNTHKTGIPHAIVTKDIAVGCIAGQALKTVTVSGPTDHPEFEFTTTQEITNKNLNVLLLRKLEVAEGGQVLLEPKHLRVNLDFQKLGMHPSQLIFRIEEPPVKGQLHLNLGPDPSGLVDGRQESIIITGREEKDRTFSMLDLWQGRVMYVHSGSEDQKDFFTFSVSSNNKDISMFLKDYHLHRFDISISPVNDAPFLSLPQGNIFTLLEKSKRLVGAAKSRNQG